jgi:DNA topoisomerase VI subunit A
VTEGTMTVREIEKAIEKLSQDDLSDLREWFYKFDNEVWDKQFESDVKAGELDRLTEKAISEYRAGKCKEL